MLIVVPATTLHHLVHILLDTGILTFVVVGGGATGVEVAGALMELFDHVLRPDFRVPTMKNVRVILLEQGERLLPGFEERQSKYALEKLQKAPARPP